MPLANSEQVRTGDVVLAIGNPMRVGQTVTMGIVSAKGRATGVGDGSFEDFLQTDAPINRGNSGGALVNTRGELVGINSQILSPSGGNIGIGFAVPSNMAKHVMESLLADGRVHRGMLGVTIQEVTPDIARSLGMNTAVGALVSSVRDAGRRPLLVLVTVPDLFAEQHRVETGSSAGGERRLRPLRATEGSAIAAGPDIDAAPVRAGR